MGDKPKEPEKGDPPPEGGPPKADPPAADPKDQALEAKIEEIVKRLTGEDGETPSAKPRTRKDIEAQAREEAARAVREVQDAEDLKRLREGEARAKEEAAKAPPTPKRHRRITSFLWGEDDR